MPRLTLGASAGNAEVRSSQQGDRAKLISNARRRQRSNTRVLVESLEDRLLLSGAIDIPDDVQGAAAAQGDQAYNECIAAGGDLSGLSRSPRRDPILPPILPPPPPLPPLRPSLPPNPEIEWDPHPRFIPHPRDVDPDWTPVPNPGFEGPPEGPHRWRPDDPLLNDPDLLDIWDPIYA
jgi:hypothetical protein